MSSKASKPSTREAEIFQVDLQMTSDAFCFVHYRWAEGGRKDGLSDGCEKVQREGWPKEYWPPAEGDRINVPVGVVTMNARPRR